MVVGNIWSLDFDISGVLSVDSIDWNEDGLIIRLSDSKRKFGLLFDDTVYMYTNTSESFKPEVWISSEDVYYPFCYYEDSEDIAYFKSKCEHIEDNYIVQFRIIGLENVVDVFISDFSKVIVWISNHILVKKQKRTSYAGSFFKYKDLFHILCWVFL